MIPIRKEMIKEKECDVFLIKGIILDVDKKPKRDGSPKFKLTISGEDCFGIQFHKSGDTNLSVGDEIIFECYKSEFNGVDYYHILNFLDGKDTHTELTEFDKKKFQEKGFDISENLLSVSAKAILFGACLMKTLSFEEGLANFKRALKLIGAKDDLKEEPILTKELIDVNNKKDIVQEQKVSPEDIERKKQAKNLTDTRLLKDNPSWNKATAMVVLGVNEENYDKFHKDRLK